MASERYSLLALQDLIAVTNQTLSALRNKIAAADQTIEDDATISDLHRDPRVIGMCRWELRVALALSEDLVNHMREAETWIRYSQRGHAGSDAPADGLLRQQRMEERWVPCPDCHMRFDPHLCRCTDEEIACDTCGGVGHIRASGAEADRIDQEMFAAERATINAHG